MNFNVLLQLYIHGWRGEDNGDKVLERDKPMEMKITIFCLVDPYFRQPPSRNEDHNDSLDAKVDDEVAENDEDGICLVDLCHHQPPAPKKPRCAAIVWLA